LVIYISPFRFVLYVSAQVQMVSSIAFAVLETDPIQHRFQSGAFRFQTGVAHLRLSSFAKEFLLAVLFLTLIFVLAHSILIVSKEQKKRYIF